MTLDEKIHLYARKLPPAFQAEVFDFVQYLLHKAEQQEDQDWDTMALSAALQDMHDEPDLYHESDVRVVFP